MKRFSGLFAAVVFVGVLAIGATARAADKAPDKFQVKFETTKGDFTVEVERKWSPIGADRFHEAVKAGFYDGCAFFRVIDGFVAQFGINGNPEVQKKWRESPIKDDPVVKSNKAGTVVFATAGKNTRTTQLFINLADNARLDDYGFSPFGQVSGDGMKVVGKLYDGYGEGAPQGKGPDQSKIQDDGNKYLKESYPKLDYIKKATIVKDGK